MPVVETLRQTDGIRVTARGMNSGSPPEIIGREYVSLAINSTCRGGFYYQRPGYKFVDLDWGGSETIQDGLFQTASYFRPRGGTGCIIAQISGQLFKFDVTTSPKLVTNITPQIKIGANIFLDPNAHEMREAWMLQAEDWLIVQNGLQRPIFYNGNTSRRAGDGEMLPGKMMEYSKGRVGYVRPDEMSIRFGDLVYGPSGTNEFAFRDSILKDTENNYLNEGGEFTVPGNFGKVTAIRNVAILDTSMGQGPVQVFTEQAVFSMNLPVDRTTWKDLQFPAQTATLIAPGATAQDATINVNGDIWYRSKDGIRTLILGVRDFTTPGNVPVSREMTYVIDADDERSLKYASAILFKNRWLVTCSPGNSFLHGTYHRGVIALDFDIVSSMSNRLPPAYDGLWTGLRVLKLLAGDFDGVERAFAFVLSSEDKIELWEITANDLFDNMTRRIEWVLETPAFFDGIQMRKLRGGEMFMDEMSGRVNLDVKYRPDQHAAWFDWSAWSECANYQTCSLANCEPPKNLKPQYRSRMRFQDDPPNACVDENNLPSNQGYTFQVRLAVTGAARLKALAVHADQQDKEPYGECRGEGVCKDSNVCNPSVFSYSSEA